MPKQEGTYRASKQLTEPRLSTESAYWLATTGILPLVTFRILFGLVAAFGAMRFMWEGWVERLIGAPSFFFNFYGFEWLPRVEVTGGYIVYTLIAISAICVSLGYRYRLSLGTFWLTFTYAELFDATNYLNHYYLVILLAGLLFFIPANGAYSLDVQKGRIAPIEYVPRWMRDVLLVQLGFVYFFAGLAKVNADWLLDAMPMAIWLPERGNYPLVGWLFQEPVTAYLFSWAGCLYDLTIVGWLLWNPTRKWAYLAVIIFHAMTLWLFNIGLFPLIMVTSTTLFFNATQQKTFFKQVSAYLKSTGSRIETFLAEVVIWNSYPGFQQQGLQLVKGNPGARSLKTYWNSNFEDEHSGKRCSEHVTALTAQLSKSAFVKPPASPTVRFSKLTPIALGVYFLIQLILPLRALAYPGPSTWSEEGYRYGWRVMLVEKSGVATFTIKDLETGAQKVVNNLDYLTPYQEKQMAIQPDFILQFAHHLADDFRQRQGYVKPAVFVESYVALNGRRSKTLVDPYVDLIQINDGLSPKPWILPRK